MTTQLLDEAMKVIPNQQILINVVSKRVRQLTQGHRPMVEVGARLDYADTALREIIAGKISWEKLSDEEIAAI
jgi:DNA-directed RNA polymerase subunit omega